MSNKIQTRDDDTKMESDRAAFMQGKYLKEHDLNVYPGNVSGFNLQSFSPYDPNNKWGSDRGEAGSFWLMTDDYIKGVVMPTYHTYDCWTKDCMAESAFYYNHIYNLGFDPIETDNNKKMPNNGLFQNDFYRSAMFSQIRFFMSYLNQGGLKSVSRSSVSAYRREYDRRDVYVAVE